MVLLKKNSSVRLLLAVVLFLVFCSISIVVLSQGRNLSKSPVLKEENPAPTPAPEMAIQVGEAGTVNKMGFADFLTIYHSYSQTKIEDERLKEKGLELQGKIDADRNKIAELEKNLNSGILSGKEKENLSKEIEELKTKITKDIQEFNLKIDNERRQTIDKLIEELRAKLSDYGKEKSYTMIFDKNELIFSDTSLDLTQEIVEYINKNDK